MVPLNPPFTNLSSNSQLSPKALSSHCPSSRNQRSKQTEPFKVIKELGYLRGRYELWLINSNCYFTTWKTFPKNNVIPNILVRSNFSRNLAWRHGISSVNRLYILQIMERVDTEVWIVDFTYTSLVSCRYVKMPLKTYSLNCSASSPQKQLMSLNQNIRPQSRQWKFLSENWALAPRQTLLDLP